MHIVDTLFTSGVARKAFYEDSMLGIAIVNKEGYFIEINNSFLEMLGYSRGEMLGYTWQSFTHPEDIYPDQKNVDIALNSRESYALIKRYRHKEGHYIKVELRVQPLDAEFVEYFVSSVLERKDVKGIVTKQDESGTPVKTVDYSWWRFIQDNPKETFILMGIVLILAAVGGNLDVIIELIGR